MSDRQILENAMDRNRGSSDMGSAMRWESKEQTNKPIYVDLNKQTNTEINKQTHKYTTKTMYSALM